MNETAVPYYAEELVTLYHGRAEDVPDWTSADVLVCDPPTASSGVEARTNAAVPVVTTVSPGTVTPPPGMPR